MFNSDMLANWMESSMEDFPISGVDKKIMGWQRNNQQPITVIAANTLRSQTRWDVIQAAVTMLMESSQRCIILVNEWDDVASSKLSIKGK